MCRLLVETVRYKRFTKFISTCSNCVKGFRISQAGMGKGRRKGRGRGKGWRSAPRRGEGA